MTVEGQSVPLVATQAALDTGTTAIVMSSQDSSTINGVSLLANVRGQMLGFCHFQHFAMH